VTFSAFFETAAFLGLVVPGETAVLVGGVVAERGEVAVPILLALVWTLAAGDVSAFLLGRRLGGPFLPGGAYVIEPGHDAWVNGDEGFVGFEFESGSAEEYAKGLNGRLARAGRRHGGPAAGRQVRHPGTVGLARACRRYPPCRLEPCCSEAISG
jgi:hypothetical protein